MTIRQISASKPQDLTDCPVPPWLTEIPPVQADDVAGTCELCGQPVWYGPTTAQMLAAGELTIGCYRCVLFVVRKQGGIELENISPGRPNRPRE